MSIEAKICNHLADLSEVKLASAYLCEECIKTGSGWIHLRTCQTCGLTHCCDDSPNKHATKHFHETGHPIIASAEPEERWLWCFQDEIFAIY